MTENFQAQAKESQQISASISQVIHEFTATSVELGLIDELDTIYVSNRLLALLALKELEESEFAAAKEQGPREENHDHSQVGSNTLAIKLLTLMDHMVDFARHQGVIEAGQANKEIMEAAIMDLVISYPSVVNNNFWQLYDQDRELATHYFYSLSQVSDYIKTRNIARNIHFTTPSDYGDLEITINLSKPEKDPAEIAKAKDAPAANYPKCALCMENEGYRGHISHAARQNHRIIRMKLGNENYGFQYSPYLYYNEHSIFLNEVHKPMQIDEKCFRNLLGIVDQFPHYFAGSNADLPIVGGSILAHDHYQGGHHIFPMDKAQAYEELDLQGHKKVKVQLLNWPMTVIRLISKDTEALVVAATYIHEAWKGYSDEAFDIIAYTGDTRHNTTTPIARYRDGYFELDLVLRNNRTNEEFPDGIFHPHQDVQHIKKENIGLIEVMGLAILPPRLVQELADVQAYLIGGHDLDQVANIHRDWAQSMKDSELAFTESNVTDYVKNQVGMKFARVLEDAGVFKQTQEGRRGLAKFIDHLKQI